MTEFLRFPKVVEFLVNQGIEDPVSPNASTAQQGDLLKYLPSKLAIDIEPARVAGSLGAVAATGYVAFNLYSSDVASWTIIMTLTGELKQVAPARSADAEGRVHWWCVVARAAVARARPLSAATTPSPPPPSPHTDPLPPARRARSPRALVGAPRFESRAAGSRTSTRTSCCWSTRPTTRPRGTRTSGTGATTRTRASAGARTCTAATTSSGAA
jgi:hypothetical protein